jgi:hypothetical protein
LVWGVIPFGWLWGCLTITCVTFGGAFAVIRSFRAGLVFVISFLGVGLIVFVFVVIRFFCIFLFVFGIFDIFIIFIFWVFVVFVFGIFVVFVFGVLLCALVFQGTAVLG